VSVVRFCGGVRCSGGCPFGGGDVFVHRYLGFDPSWEVDADAMRVALAAHDEVLRGAIEAHGGWLFKHTGDGVCAAFASPIDAVQYGVRLKRLRYRDWTTCRVFSSDRRSSEE
jgi:hypothetical protein